MKIPRRACVLIIAAAGIVAACTPPTGEVPGAPAAPDGVAATVHDYSAVALSWTDNSDDEDGFSVERRSNAETAYLQVADLPPDSFSYDDETAAASATAYHYRVRAHNAAGTSESSNIVTVETITPPATETAYVCSLTGDDIAEAGDTALPYKSIGYALSLAAANGYTRILVAGGVYSETIELANGVSLFGGYDGERWDAGAAITTIISDETEDYTVRGSAITSTTTLNGFTIRGPISPSGSTATIYLVDCTEAMIVSNNTVYGGQGARGNDGSPGETGENGGDGGDGRDSYQIFDTGATSNTGGPRGELLAAPAANGGYGGSATNPVKNWVAESGTLSGGSGGVDAATDGVDGHFPGSGPISGVSAGSGSDGADGFGGISGDATGALTSGLWIAGSGGDGSAGSPGSGAGGGGASGGMEDTYLAILPNIWIVGASGGGGGAGGNGGGAGAGGQGGGGSFAIFVHNTAEPSSLPAVRNNILSIGEAGDGGAGGTGGIAGLGGNGGSGGALWTLSGPHSHAGDGGRGGDGGHGGGGGGGAGGMACGVGVNRAGFTGTIVDAGTNAISGGTAGNGGSGGLSLGVAGDAGQDGSVVAIEYW